MFKRILAAGLMMLISQAVVSMGSSLKEEQYLYLHVTGDTIQQAGNLLEQRFQALKNDNGSAENIQKVAELQSQFDVTHQTTQAFLAKTEKLQKKIYQKKSRSCLSNCGIQ